MKKSFAMVLALILIPCAALAEIDLSSLSFADLSALRDQAQLEMMKRDEWQEVTVPQGVWEVGKDIPIAHWSISLSPNSSSRCAAIKYCDMLNEAGTDAGNRVSCKIYDYLDVGAPTNDRYPQVIDLDLKPGTYIIISNGSVVFTPYTGKPDLGFK
jgi:hypothetical protein